MTACLETLNMYSGTSVKVYFVLKVWWEPILLKKSYIFGEKEISLGEKCVHGMFIESFKNTCKKITNKKM